MEGPIRLRKVREDPKIFRLTETASPRPQLAKIVASCNALHYNVLNSCKGLSKDVMYSLAEYTSASAVIVQPRLREWRSQAQYSKGRNRILRLLSRRNCSCDEESEAIFSRLIFHHSGSPPRESTEPFKFTVPGVLSPRMAQLLRSNKRPFGGKFTSPRGHHKTAASADVHDDSIADYLKEEIGKYQTNRMDRLLRIPELGQRKSVIVSTCPSSPLTGLRKRGSVASLADTQSLYLAHKSAQQSQTQLPVSRPSVLVADMERNIMQDIHKARCDMAEVLRTEKLMAGAQVVQLGRFKAFKASLKTQAERH